MKKVIAISLTLTVCSVKANSLCTLNPVSAEKVVKIQGVPGWFFKVHPDGDVASYIGSDSNQMLDMNSGVQKPTLGTIDPVWAPDGSHMTHPGEEATGIQLFPGKEMLEASFSGEPQRVKPTNSPLGGVYQSIGKKDGKFSMISDASGVSLIDYEYGANGATNISQPRRPCNGLDYGRTDLPMISKDGRFISIYDSNSKSTKIYKLNTNGNCSLALDMGYGTGKVSFNADSSQIAFHIDQFSDFQTGYFSGVGKDKIKNVMVMNLEESEDGKLNPTSWALASRHIKPGDGGYYPDFDKHGNIYFMEDVNNNFQFVKVNQSNLEFRPMHRDLVFGNLNCAPEHTPSAPVLLAMMWKDVCGKENLPSAELIMGINPAECRKMVNDFYNPRLNATKEELLEYCPQETYAAPHAVGAWNPNQKLQAEELLKGKCLNCHRTPKSAEVTETLTIYMGGDQYQKEELTYVKRVPPIKLESLDYVTAEQMLESIKTGAMPKKEPLSNDEKGLLSDYLEKRILDMKPYGIDDYLTVNRYSEAYLKRMRDFIEMDNPTMPANEKQMRFYEINCKYGQINCNEFIASKRPGIDEAAQKLPETERQNFINEEILGLRCVNLFEVTPHQCREWQKRKLK